MSYLLGLDAGNTKTIALVARLDGGIVGVGRAGCGDIYGAVSAEAALEAIEQAATAALEQAGVRPEALVAGAFSAAGADWPEDFELLRAEMERRGLGRSITIVNDAVGALRAGSAEGPAVVVACGTGAAIAARGHAGQIWHSSFWQEPQGSQQLAEKTLRAVYRAELGIDPPTALTARVLDFFGQASVEEVLHLFTARIKNRPPHTRGLARALLDEAAAGDPTARRIVLEHGTSLGDYALAAARRVGITTEPFTLVLTGGVLRHPSTLLTSAIVERVRAAAPDVHPVNSRFEPVVGALFLAFESLGVAVDDALLARLLPTVPASSLFAT